MNQINFKGVLKESTVRRRTTNNNTIKMGRVKLVKVRIRMGKIQKRVKVSLIKGFTYRSGKLVRISALEKRHRMLGAKRAKFKRKAKLTRTKFKIQRSLRRRYNLGLH